MTSEQFTYWLQGFVELNDGPPSTKQWKIVEDHLKLVFTKVTPNYNLNASPTVLVPNFLDTASRTYC